MSEINKKAITDLANLLKELDLGQIEYKNEEFQIKVAARAMEAAPYVPAAVPVAPVAAVPAEEKPKACDEKNLVRSPMVGVVYLSSDPEGPNFVQRGSLVKQGQTLCLIEAMKTFNPLKAPRDGKIADILIDNETPVEFSQQLFVLE